MYNGACRPVCREIAFSTKGDDALNLTRSRSAGIENGRYPANNGHIDAIWAAFCGGASKDVEEKFMTAAIVAPKRN